MTGPGEDGMLGRVSHLERSVNALSNDNARFTQQLHGVEAGQVAMSGKLDQLVEKLDKSRPGIGTIWVPIAAMTALLGLIGTAVSGPQLVRLDRLELVAEARTEQIAAAAAEDSRSRAERAAINARLDRQDRLADAQTLRMSERERLSR